MNSVKECLNRVIVAGRSGRFADEPIELLVVSSLALLFYCVSVVIDIRNYKRNIVQLHTIVLHSIVAIISLFVVVYSIYLYKYIGSNGTDFK